MRRREFVTLLGNVVAASGWPVDALAQRSAMPVIGFLSSFTTNPRVVAAFRQGLGEAGYVEGQNVAIEYHWSEGGQYGRLPTVAADLVGRQVAVIVASPIPAALAAKAATTTIPIVFAIGSDPIESGLVSSLNRPGGNITGVSFLSVELGAKRVELLHEFVPKVTSIALLVNPNNTNAEPQIKETRLAATGLGLNLDVLRASSKADFDLAFAALLQQRAGALVVSADPFFISQRDQLIALAARHAVPAMYYAREFAEAGGLMSYGSSFAVAHRQAGVYAGRILMGQKPSDLPVMLSDKFEFVINFKTAKALGVEVPPRLLALADEVIE
jgi:putative tryptophan/tyrosine transport system substrate-binding protein